MSIRWLRTVLPTPAGAAQPGNTAVGQERPVDVRGDAPGVIDPLATVIAPVIRPRVRPRRVVPAVLHYPTETAFTV